jgi:hypothetical protein
MAKEAPTANAGMMPAASDVGIGDGKGPFAATVTSNTITSTTSATKDLLTLTVSISLCSQVALFFPSINFVNNVVLMKLVVWCNWRWIEP